MTTSWVAPAADVRRSRAWVLIVVLLGAVVFGWTNAPEAEAGLPPTSISLEKTVGLDPDICAVDDEITVGPGTDVTYCYYVTNTGLSDLTSHDLTDSELGDILTDFPYILAPGASAYTTLGATIDDTTTNTATWTATNTDTGASATGTDSATVNVEPPSITLAKTVGLDPNICAVDDEITVGPGTDVTYCYYVTNTGLSDLTSHDLTDSELGDILTDFPYILAPGASAWVTQSATIDDTTTNTATWTATNPDIGASATGTDSATVNVEPPSITLAKTVGLDPDICAVDDEITVGPGTDVTYCYYVTNTGLSDLTSHDLTDSELGDILTDFAFILAPGASAWVTQSATIDDTTTNTATWTATNPDIGASATGTDSATVNVPVPSITLAKTVGLDPDVCAVDDEITVGPGTDVTYCYYMTNTGDVPFDSHDLTDSELGDILTGFPVVIAPGASAWLTQGATIDETTTNTATWTATDTETDASATGTDSATVVVPVPSISLVKTVGTDAASCAVDVLITVAADTEVTYCYTVTNTGDAPLTMHDLSDSELGDVLTDFPEMLEPAASFFVTASATIGVDTTNTATWTARDPELGLLAAASADATVEIALEPTTTTTTTTTTTGAAVTPTSTAPGGEVAANVAERGSSSLPVTGSDLGVLAWLGLALLVLGGAALGLSRRRA